MCGIAGAIWTDARVALTRPTLDRMTDALRHRGPDEGGTYFNRAAGAPANRAFPAVALGHRRLSIIDIANSHQPLANEDETVWLVFNGEIYNYVALRRRLEGAGHRFQTAGDTETIVHLYEQEGLDFLQHLVGMFALALWDARRRRLILARDRLGQKPLVYRQEADRLLFASELKGLMAVPDVPREIDPGAVDRYLTYQYVPHPETIFRGIRKLPPAHYGVYQEGRLSIRRYWSPDMNREVRRPFSESVQRVRRLCRDAVAMRMRSDVPLGAFLSGGVDSSIVVALMQQVATAPVQTFSIGFTENEYDESGWARRVATHLGTDHHPFQVTPDSLEILPQLVRYFDEPFADSSAIPTFYVARWARERVTVALTGDGGDELFCGYPRYRAIQLASRLDRLPRAVRSMLAASERLPWPHASRQKSLTRRWRRFVSALALPPAARYAEWIAIFSESRRAALYTDAMLDALPNSDPIEWLGDAFQDARARDPLTQASLADLVTYLPCDLMTKVDTASMANSLECRQPLLDHRLVELAIETPIDHKFHGSRGKRVFKEAFGHLLPAGVLQRRKMGFGVPLDHWFRHELSDFAQQVLLDPSTHRRGYFRPDAVARLLDEHRAGVFQHGYRLWALLVFELWQREWIDRTGGGHQVGEA